jgi:hypothetical protein
MNQTPQVAEKSNAQTTQVTPVTQPAPGLPSASPESLRENQQQAPQSIDLAKALEGLKAISTVQENGDQYASYLQANSTGESVKLVQHYLLELLKAGKIDVSGLPKDVDFEKLVKGVTHELESGKGFGGYTRLAVLSLQKSYGLDETGNLVSASGDPGKAINADGVFGIITQNVLFQLLSRQVAESAGLGVNAQLNSQDIKNVAQIQNQQIGQSNILALNEDFLNHVIFSDTLSSERMKDFRKATRGAWSVKQAKDAGLTPFEASDGGAIPSNVQENIRPVNAQQLLELFQGDSNSVVARAIGLAEGTRDVNGGKTAGYYGHDDPGNGVWNRGTFSYQHEASSPEDADAKQLLRLQKQADILLAQAQTILGRPLNNQELLYALDLANQAPLAALDDSGGFVARLAESYSKGLSGYNAILEARVNSYINPATGRLDAPGFGNNAERLKVDQNRRMTDMLPAMGIASPQEAVAQTMPTVAPSSTQQESVFEKLIRETKSWISSMSNAY